MRIVETSSSCLLIARAAVVLNGVIAWLQHLSDTP